MTRNIANTTVPPIDRTFWRRLGGDSPLPVAQWPVTHWHFRIDRLMGQMRGYSLIELMVAVVVVAILATVALPSFRQYSVRSNRTVAKTVLSQIAQQQETWFSDRKSYASRLTLLGYPADALYVDAAGEMRSGASSSSIYRVSLAGVGTSEFSRCSANVSPTAATRFSWVLLAEPQNAQVAGDYVCGTLCLYSTGQRGATSPVDVDQMFKQCWAK